MQDSIEERLSLWLGLGCPNWLSRQKWRVLILSHVLDQKSSPVVVQKSMDTDINHQDLDIHEIDLCDIADQLSKFG